MRSLIVIYFSQFLEDTKGVTLYFYEMPLSLVGRSENCIRKMS